MTMIIKKISATYRKKLGNYRANVSQAPQLDVVECNKKLGEALRTKTPFFVGRIGWTEGVCIGRFITEGFVPKKLTDTLHHVSGVFPIKDEELKKFSSIYLDALSHVDILGLMPAHYQGWLVKTYGRQALTADLHSIEPYFCEEPWSWWLQGLTVLVIHPFSESIMRQYSTVRTQLFRNSKMLPEFKLKVIKTPQTIGGPTKYASWSETFSALKQQVEQEDFDVAIIGCGAYGFPLAAAVKEMGKIAIHLGGVTQLLFGIRGRRWIIEQPKYHSIMTEAWCSPSESERPAGWEKIEEGCYW